MKNPIVFICIFILSGIIIASVNEQETLIIQRVKIGGNEACTYIQNTGIFNQNTSSANAPGLSLPCDSQFYGFTAGINAACKIDSHLAMFAGSYRGELAPGYILNNTYKTNSDFKIYHIKSTDNEYTNPDYANWYKMIPYNAPFIDMNNNCAYDAGIDKPGMPDAAQTVFICMTDALASERNPGEGFGGGITNPLLMAEIRLTVWTYSDYPFSSSQMFRYQIINKGVNKWDSLYFALFSDMDMIIGNNMKDVLGCDSVKHIGFTYTGDSSGRVAGGIRLHKGLINKFTNESIYMSSFTWNRSAQPCEWEVPGNPQAAYNYMKGYKSDGTSYLDPTRPLGNGRYLKTKYIYSGDPDTNTGWTAAKGRINNCGGVDTGTVVPVVAGDRKMIIGIGAGNLTMMPSDTQVIVFSQLLARGTNNLNAVTELKRLSDKIDFVYQREIKNYAEKFCWAVAPYPPEDFALFQNYPNPFNAVTNIKFNIPRIADVKLEVFDITGKSIALLASGEYNPGFYEVSFDGLGYSSGVYFFRLEVLDKTVNAQKFYSTVKKMILIK